MRIAAFLALLPAAAPGIIQAQCTPSAAVQTDAGNIPTASDTGTGRRINTCPFP